ncbi:hypothetical protein BJ322DRAFT_1039692 [Thelephora terrestris]|uniref:Uncharacterized protein n=1 Tax=Thelephora terrestris TaxID=56493 RepID=A0A9P6HN30_9AGAM|nr:hypothetical protein BJ322DRAFT_1039692 [Thelephora terrestris]
MRYSSTSLERVPSPALVSRSGDRLRSSFTSLVILATSAVSGDNPPAGCPLWTILWSSTRKWAKVTSQPSTFSPSSRPPLFLDELTGLYLCLPFVRWLLRWGPEGEAGERATGGVIPGTGWEGGRSSEKSPKGSGSDTRTHSASRRESCSVVDE